MQTLGRLADPDEFANIVVKQTPIAVVRLKDVARVELAAQDYSSNSYLDRDPAVALAVFQRPGSNALATAKGIHRDDGDRCRSGFRPASSTTSSTTRPQFIQQSVDEVQETILEADPAGRAGRHPVPADLARRHHSDRRHSGLAHRHLLLHGDVRLHAQQSVAVRPGARDRHRGRRRDRRGGERRAQYRGRSLAARRRASRAWTRSARR